MISTFIEGGIVLKNIFKGSILFSVLIISMIFSTSKVDAQINVPLYVINGQTQSFHLDGIEKNGSTFIPLRGVFETLGASVNWDNKNQSITAKKGSSSVFLKVGSKLGKVNGKNVSISAVPFVKEGKTYVPLRFVSEALGATVNWSKYEPIYIYGSKANLSAWIGTYINWGMSARMYSYSININKITEKSLTFTSVYTYVDDSNNDLRISEMPEKSIAKTGVAQLVSNNKAIYNEAGCYLELHLKQNTIEPRNFSGSACSDFNIIGFIDGMADTSKYQK